MYTIMYMKGDKYLYQVFKSQNNFESLIIINN